MAAPYQTTRKANAENSTDTAQSTGYQDAYQENESYGYSETTQSKNQGSTTSANYYAVANHDNELYNWLYQVPNPTSFQDGIVNLQQYNDQGELKMFPFVVVDNSAHPWVKVYITINDTKRFGYIHADIALQMLDEVVVNNHNISNQPSVVKAEDGANIYRTPGGEKLQKEPLTFNEEVFVISVDEYDWAHVKYKGQEGYINITRLNTGIPMPGTGSKLYKIKKGDTLESIINSKFKLQEGEDRRFYANVLMHINNPGNRDNRGIFINEDFDFFGGITPSYDRFHVKENFLIWIPQKAYADALKGSINSGSYREEIKRKISSFGEIISTVVDEYWPVNWGAFYGSEIGATFAYPVGVDSQVETYFFRKDENTIALKKYDRLALGLDTGVSAGFYIGGKNSKKGSAGLGAQAGANAEVKGAVYGMAEYEFPIKDDDAILSALMAILKGDSTAVNLATLFLDALGGMQLNPSHYMTKGKLALGVEAQVNASASIGAKKAGTDNRTESYTHKGSNASDKQADNYGGTALEMIDPLNKKVKLKDFALKYLNIGAEALLKINPKIGVEFSRKLKHEGEVVSVSEQTMDIFIEMGTQAKLQANLSVLGKLGPVFDRGMGLKMSFTAKSGEEWSAPTFSLYTMSGELDYYDGGGASQAELDLGSDIKSVGDTLKNIKDADFISLVKDIKFTKRAVIAGFMSRSARIAKTKSDEQKHSQKADYNNFLLTSEAYLDVVVDLGKVEEQVLSDIKDLVKESFAGDSISERFLNGLKTIIDWSKGTLESIRGNGSLPTNQLFMKFTSLLNKAIQSDIFPSVIFHARIGAGFAAGANLALGAKVKLSGSIAGGFVFEMDVKDLLKDFIRGEKTQDFIAQFNQDNPTINNEVATELENQFRSLIDS